LLLQHRQYESNVESDVSRNDDNDYWHHMNQRRDEALAKVVEAFEEIAKLTWLSPTLLKDRVIDSTHHWSKQNPERYGVTNQHAYQAPGSNLLTDISLVQLLPG
jgi:hypothetical protein